MSVEHPDDALSDLAAGTSPDDPELAEAARHVEGCARCQAIVDDERAVRGLLGSLPPVDPPERFFPDLIRRRHRAAIAVVAASVLAALGAWGLVVDDTSGVTGEVSPDVEALRTRHMEATAAGGFEPMADEDDMPAPYRDPELLAGQFTQVGRYHGADGVMQVTYTDGDVQLSVFEQAGSLRTDDLPGEMQPVDLGDAGYEIAGDPVRVVVVRRGDLVYTLVGAVERAVIVDAVADLPEERHMSMSRRVTLAVDDLMEDLGLGF